jgi:hypothetical protein
MEPLSTSARRIIWIGCLVPFASSIALILWYWPGSLPQDNASGVWTALAQDLARGIFYRPAADAFGFGGTRYMPLFFTLHAGLIRLSLDPVTAGMALSLASAVLFDLAVLAALRELGVESPLAIPLSILTHATVAFQLLTLQVKGDFLAAALNMWGIGLGLRCARRPSAPLTAACALAFLGAFLTKFTTVSGAVAVCGWLYWCGRRRAAVALAGTLGVLALGSLTVIDWASGGRAFASFAAVAAGGMHTGYALDAPLWFLRSAAQDPVSLIVLAGASMYAVARFRGGDPGFAPAYFVLAAGFTLLIFTSPGTDTNHFLDVLGAAALLFGDQLTREPRRARLAVGVPAVLAGLTAATWIPGMISVRSVIEKDGWPRRREVSDIAARLGPAAYDLLSENPILPVMLGQRPRVLDPFNLRLLARDRPEVAREFRRRMDANSFGAVVLSDYTGADLLHTPAALQACTASDGARCYGGVVFPPGFLRLLERDYVLSFVEHPFVVYTPRRGLAAQGLVHGRADPPDRRVTPLRAARSRPRA